MKKITSFFLSVVLLFTFSVYAFAESEENFYVLPSDNTEVYSPGEENIDILPDGSAYVNNCVTVYFKDNAPLSEMRKVFRYFGESVLGFFEPLNQYQFRIKKSSVEKIQKICDFLMGFPCVQLAVPSFASVYSEQSVPNDPWDGYAEWNSQPRSWYSQWWIKAVEADKAWDYNEYFNHIKVGIVDSGFDTAHEDLAGRFSFPDKYLEKSNYPKGHGTHVAGIIGAVPNNNKGITGLVWDCELVCTDWLPDKNHHQVWATDERILTGLVRNVMAGAKAVNFSLGSAESIPNGTTQRYKIAIDSEALVSSFVIAKLISKGYDFLAIQSAGNGTTLKNGDFYAVDSVNNGTFACVTPENVVSLVDGVTKQDILDRIIIVGSAKCNNDGTYSMSYFSDGGENVSIYAPGSNIYSTYYYDSGAHNDYSFLNGTSMACPVVTGIASMVWSVNPDFTGPQVKKIICSDKNTPVVVKDCEDECHLPTGDGRMINAKLSVEDAISKLDFYGKVSGQAGSGKAQTPYKITNTVTGETFRGRTDENGKFEKSLPQGEYVIEIGTSIGAVSADFTVVKGDTTVIGNLYQPGLHFGKLKEFSETVSSYIKNIAELILKSLHLLFNI